MSMLFLGVIALATLVMAVVQVGVVVYGARVAQRVNKLVDRVEAELDPTLDRVNAISGDVQRATSLARSYVERAEGLGARLVERVDRATLSVHDAIVEPTRQGRAVWEGIRAAISVFRKLSHDGPTTDGREATRESRQQEGEGEPASPDSR